MLDLLFMDASQQLATLFWQYEAFKWDPDKGFVLASGETSRITWTAGPCLRIPMPGGSSRNSHARPSATSPSMRWVAWKSEPFPCPQLYPIMPLQLNHRKPTTPLSSANRTKEHGLGKRIEGVVKANDRVLVVDDVLTSGGSLLQALHAARDAQLHASHALVIVDRQEQEGKKTIEAQGVSLISLLTLDDLKTAQPDT